jgi:hypothetical protein
MPRIIATEWFGSTQRSSVAFFDAPQEFMASCELSKAAVEIGQVGSLTCPKLSVPPQSESPDAIDDSKF